MSSAMEELEKSEDVSRSLEAELELIHADFQDELVKGLPEATIEVVFDFFAKIYKRKVLEFSDAKKRENECRKLVPIEELEKREEAQAKMRREMHSQFMQHGVINRTTQTR